MATAPAANRRQDESSDGGAVRPWYIHLGTDTRGRLHCWDRKSGTVHLIHENGSRERRRLDDWMDAIDGAFGWAEQRYYPTAKEAWEETFDTIAAIARGDESQ